MPQTFTFTPKELAAAVILTKDALNGMGGKRPSDFEHDEFTWCNIKALMNKGHSQHEAAGLFSSLHSKGFIEGEYNSKRCETNISTSGWRYLDTIWDTSI